MEKAVIENKHGRGLGSNNNKKQSRKKAEREREGEREICRQPGKKKVAELCCCLRLCGTTSLASLEVVLPEAAAAAE